MKANELMIGDWVLWTFNDDTYPEKIGSLVYGDVGYEPIILTEEILKANGFELYLFEHYIHRYDNNPNHYNFKLTKGGVFSNEGYRMKCEICDITIKYVHELQHALRLCGLNGLADNFKIK